MNKQPENDTFQLLAAGAFLEFAITMVNGHILAGSINKSANDELRKFRDIRLMHKKYEKAFNDLRVTSNSNADRIDSKTRKMIAAKLARTGVAYDENTDLEEGYKLAAGDIVEFMRAWIAAKTNSTIDELMERVNEFKD